MMLFDDRNIEREINVMHVIVMQGLPCILHVPIFIALL